MRPPSSETYRRGVIPGLRSREPIGAAVDVSEARLQRSVAAQSYFRAGRILGAYLRSGSNDERALLDMVCRAVRTSLGTVGDDENRLMKHGECDCCIEDAAPRHEPAGSLGASRLGIDLTANGGPNEAVPTVVVRVHLTAPTLLLITASQWRVAILTSILDRLTPLYMDWSLEFLPRGNHPALGSHGTHDCCVLGQTWTLGGGSSPPVGFGGRIPEDHCRIGSS
jgi:hypothetical protein